MLNFQLLTQISTAIIFLELVVIVKSSIILYLLQQAFFVERVFKIFDKDGNNKISLAEFLDTMYQYAAHQTNSEKVLFLFKVYDIDGKIKFWLLVKRSSLAHKCNIHSIIDAFLYWLAST